MSKKIELGVYVGRFCPPHLGHGRVLDYLIDNCGFPNSLVLVGSSNHPISYRHLFPLEDRLEMLQKLYHGLNVTGIPDQESDASWLANLWSLISCWRHGREGENDRQVVFYSGCEEDVLFFLNAGYDTKILNRYDGTGPKICATEVRDALVHGRSIENLVAPEIAPLVLERFTKRWEELKKR